MEPDLRLVPLDSIQLQEETDAARLQRLVEAMQKSGVLKDPPIVAKGLGTKLIQLDGTTRLNALRKLSCSHVVVQFVDYNDTSQVLIKSWVHVSRVNQSNFIKRIKAIKGVATEEFKLGLGLRLTGHPLAAVSIIFRNGWGLSVLSNGDLFAKAATMKRIVNLYAQLITRDREVSLEGMQQLADFFAKHKDKNVALLFPSLSSHDIYSLMKKKIELPQGVTRHIIQSRVLRINYPLAMLKQSVRREEKELYCKKFLSGLNFRLYEESTLVVE